MTEKIVKTRKDHKCGQCEEIIKSGSDATFWAHRYPRFADDHETQIGVWYERMYFCINQQYCTKTANKKADEQANF